MRINKIERGDVIKSPKMMDVCLAIHSVDRRMEGYSCEVEWIALGQPGSKSYSFGIVERVLLDYNDLDEWGICTKPDADYLRDQEFIRIGTKYGRGGK